MQCLESQPQRTDHSSACCSGTMTYSYQVIIRGVMMNEASVLERSHRA